MTIAIVVILLGALAVMLGGILFQESLSQPSASPSSASSKTDGTKYQKALIESKTHVLPISDNTKYSHNYPIQWDFENFDSIFGFNDSFDNQSLVSVYRINGKNISDSPIRNIESYVIPDATNQRIFLKFVTRQGMLAPKDTYGIPAGSEFSLAFIIPAIDKRNKQGILLNEYMKRYGGFKFVFNYDDGKRIEKYFPYQEVRQKLREIVDRRDEGKKRPEEIKKREC